MLFLETSAQIQRLVGCPEMQKGINALVYAEPKPRIGTSATVKREFDHTYVGLFGKLKQAALAIPKRASPVPFENLLLEIQGQVGSYYPGGPNFLIYICTTLAARFGGETFTVNRLLSVLDSEKEKLELGFLADELFDKSSCTVWETRGPCVCETTGADCRLREMAVDNRENFLATAVTLAGAGRDESRHINRILDRLQTTEGKALLELLGKHRAHVGDPLIFWEVPEGWTILSRDVTFKIFRDKHRTDIDFYMVRLPRIRSDTACTFRLNGETTNISGTLLNHNAKGARIHARSMSVKQGQSVTVTSAEFQHDREGHVSPYDDQSDPDSFGLKFK